MLLLVVCMFLISKASALNYDSLVGDINKTLDECLAIVEDASNYVEEVHAPDYVRRLQDEEIERDAVLGACASIIESVDTYRVNHDKQWLMSLLRWPENAVLNFLLSSVSKKMGEVLYVASKDGDDVSDFHSACDGKGATISVFLSANGAVFGGYTDASWHSAGGTMTSSTSFVFRLRPSIERYDIISGKESVAIFTRSYDGPCFGNPHAFRIRNNSLSNYDSYTEGSNIDGTRAYSVPINDGYNLNAGEKHFKLVDYFVAEAVND